MSDMRIVHLIGGLDPSAGGPPVVAARLAAAQAKLGARVTLMAYQSSDGRDRAQRLLEETPHAELLEVCWIPSTRLERVLGRWAARSFEERHKAAEIDILHTHGMWDPLMPATARIARARGIPYVVTPHGMLDPYTLSVKRMKKRIALATTHRAFLHNAAFIHMLNADEASLAAPVIGGVPARVVPNGVFLEEFENLPEPGAFRATRPELGDRPYVLFLSRLAHKKGLDYLAAAFDILHRSMPEVDLVVVGPDDGQQAEFESTIAQKRLSHRVHVVGPMYGRDKLAVLRDAAVFCLPSRQEGFSIAITEALAIGVPVVVTQACHFPEITEVGAGTETDLDASQIAHALQAILSDRAAAAAMGAAGAELIRQRFTWPNIARLTLGLYHDAISGAMS